MFKKCSAFFLKKCTVAVFIIWRVPDSRCCEIMLSSCRCIRCNINSGWCGINPGEFPWDKIKFVDLFYIFTVDLECWIWPSDIIERATDHTRNLLLFDKVLERNFILVNFMYFLMQFLFSEFIKLCWKFLNVETNQLWLWEGLADNLVRKKISMPVDLWKEGFQ